MKKTLSVALALVFCIVLVAPSFALDTRVTPRYNNVASVTPSFYIASNGDSVVTVSYQGFEGITTKATITTVIQKKTMWWWSDVDNTDWVIEITEPSGEVEHRINLKNSGTYRLVYEVRIEGTGGATDVISGEIEDSF